MQNTLKIKKISEDAITPNYAHIGDAGFDLYSTSDIILSPGEMSLIHTGIQIELPKDMEGQVRPRSGLFLKHQVSAHFGTIDNGYRGEIGVMMINHGKNDFHITKGMKIAQMILQPIYRANIIEVAELNDNTERGSNGYGSSGI